MSVQSTIKRKTAPDIRARRNGEPIVMLTSYHARLAVPAGANIRSEEHTSELQSPCNLVCRLLLEKKMNYVDIWERTEVRVNGRRGDQHHERAFALRRAA